MYTPAVTIVAAWISADTGVGPSMASGQPDIEGNLRRLAGGADKQQQRDQRHRSEHRLRVRAAPASARFLKVERAEADERAASTPRMKPKSPIRLTMNAFLPASDADFF